MDSPPGHGSVSRGSVLGPTTVDPGFEVRVVSGRRHGVVHDPKAWGQVRDRTIVDL